LEVTLKRESKDFHNKDIKYELSALLDADSFFYGLFDYGDKLVFANEISFINELGGESWRDRISLRKTKIGLLNNLVLIIPESEFQPADIPYILSATCNLPDISQYIIRSDRIEKHDIRVCYAVPKELVKIMTDTLDGPILNHYVSAFLHSISDTSLDALFIDFSCKSLIVIACKDGRLVFINNYEVEENLNAFYWISLAHQSIFGEDRFVPIFYSGKLMETSSLRDTLESYYAELKKMIQPISIDGFSIKEEVSFYPLHCISEM
jgi:hypothetical protein